MSRAEAVVLVHGIWMSRLAMVPLQQRLQRAGFAGHILSYPSLRGTPQANGARLRRLIERLEAPRVHLVGHSLGGLVVLHLLEGEVPERVGRAVLLGSPVNGSGVAHVLASSRFTRHLLGRSVERGLLGAGPHADGRHPVGVIAGALPFGLGALLPGLADPHDGTVAVSETHLAGAAATVVLPVSHTGMLFSRAVAQHVAAFLRTGRFPDAVPT